MDVICAADLACSLVVFLFLVVLISTEKTSSEFVQDSLVSFLEGLLETFGKTLESLRSNSLLLASNLASLLLESSLSGLGCLDGGLLGSGSEVLGSWVDFLHLDSVLEWVLLSLVGEVDSGSLISELGLNLIGVNDSGEVSNRHHVSSELESRLLDGSLSVGTEDLIELLEGILGEDNESSEVTTWSELEEVQSGDVASVNTWEVSGSSLDDWVLIGVDNEWSLAESESGGSHLSLSWSESLGLTGTGKIVTESEVSEG